MSSMEINDQGATGRKRPRASDDGDSDVDDANDGVGDRKDAAPSDAVESGEDAVSSSSSSGSGTRTNSPCISIDISGDPDDNGSDLDDFIVSGDDDEDGGDDPRNRDDSEADYVPAGSEGREREEEEDSDVIVVSATRRLSDGCISLSSDDDDDDGDGSDADSDCDDPSPPHDRAAGARNRPRTPTVAAPAAPRKRTKREAMPESETSHIDPTNIVSGRRTRRTTERYMDRHFMEYMVRDVPTSQIAAVFDDSDEYFATGVSLSDDSPDEEAGSGDDDAAKHAGDDDDMDSSDYEALDALSWRRPRRARRQADVSASQGAEADGTSPPLSDHDPEHDGRVAAEVADGGSTLDAAAVQHVAVARSDVVPLPSTRPPSTVAALLRTLAAQPGGLRPSAASPRSAPVTRGRGAGLD